MFARRLLPALLAASLAACGEPAKVSPPVLALSESSLAFAGVAQGADPAARQVIISNAGGGTLGTPSVEVSYGAGAGWLAATATGTAAPYTLTVQPRLAGLAAGTYLATVRVASVSSAGPAQTVGVTLEVSAVPIPSGMALSPAALELRAATPGADPASQVVNVTATGTTPLAAPVPTVTYGATAQGWLTATVGGSAAPYTVTVQVATTGLPLGVHTATVELASAGATNTPRSFPVTLLVGRAVDVARALTFWTEDGATTTAPDEAVTGVALLQDDGAGGLARTPAVRALAAGTWTAVAAPGGYLAEVAFADGRLVYLQAAADRLDAGEDRGGRAGGAAPTLPTSVTLDLSGLFAWDTTNDNLRLLAWDAQAALFLQPSIGQGNESDTVTLDWLATGGRLLQPSDRLRVGQYRFSSGTISYDELQTATDQAGFTLTDGVGATLTMPLAGTPIDSPYDLTWALAAMEAASAPFDPAAAGFAHRVGSYAIPAPLTAPSPVGAAPATVFEALEFAGAADTLSDRLSVGRLLPASWKEYRETAFTTPAARLVAPATNPAVLQQVVLHREAMPAAAAAGPLLGVVQAPLVAGLDALASVSGVPLAATLSWDAPATGTPTSYRVAVHELTAQGGATVSHLVAEFGLPATSRTLTLPAGLLLPGHAYAALITARASPGDAGDASPYRVGLPYGEASLWTGVFTTVP